MSDRRIFDEYELRGAKFEVWDDGYNWSLVACSMLDAAKCGVAANTVLIESDFSPPLSAKETQAIHDAIRDWHSD